MTAKPLVDLTVCKSSEFYGDMFAQPFATFDTEKSRWGHT